MTINPVLVRIIRFLAYLLIAVLILIVIVQRLNNGALESIPNSLANFGFSIESFLNGGTNALETNTSNNNDPQAKCNTMANEIILNQLNAGNPNGSKVTTDSFIGIMKFTLYKAFYDPKRGSCFFAYYVMWIKAPGELYQRTLAISDTAKAKPVWTKNIGTTESQDSMFEDLDVAINYIQIAGQ